MLHEKLEKKFNLAGRVAIITGAAGLLGRRHAQTIMMSGGVPILIDVEDCTELKKELLNQYDGEVIIIRADVTQEADLFEAKERILNRFGKIDILINNAANNPNLREGDNWYSRFENFSLDQWQKDIDVGLTGAFLCSREFGGVMAKSGKGVILNMSSDLGLIGPDQRIYHSDDLPYEEQPFKAVSYSVVKSGIIGLTRYLATYWAECGVRVNALAPGGVENDQDPGFRKRLSQVIPMNRMAKADEYQAAVAFMVSDASSYMTGAVVSIDGGRTAW